MQEVTHSISRLTPEKQVSNIQIIWKVLTGFQILLPGLTYGWYVFLKSPDHVLAKDLDSATFYMIFGLIGLGLLAVGRAIPSWIRGSLQSMASKEADPVKASQLRLSGWVTSSIIQAAIFSSVGMMGALSVLVLGEFPQMLPFTGVALWSLLSAKPDPESIREVLSELR